MLICLHDKRSLEPPLFLVLSSLFLLLRRHPGLRSDFLFLSENLPYVSLPRALGHNLFRWVHLEGLFFSGNLLIFNCRHCLLRFPEDGFVGIVIIIPEDPIKSIDCELGPARILLDCLCNSCLRRDVKALLVGKGIDMCITNIHATVFSLDKIFVPEWVDIVVWDLDPVELRSFRWPSHYIINSFTKLLLIASHYSPSNQNGLISLLLIGLFFEMVLILLAKIPYDSALYYLPK